MTGAEAVVPLTATDVPWIAELMVARRALYATFSPVFWRPAPNARDVHEPHLASCVSSEQFVGFRTTHGFLLGELQAAGTPPWWPDVPIGSIDDFAVDADATWTTDGRVLLLTAWAVLNERGAEAVRVVSARRDEAKVALLESLGLTTGESWWVRVVDAPISSDTTFGPISADGVEGLVIPAPPVYDPGGPVLLVTSLDDANNVAAVPAFAAEHGAVLAIVSSTPTRRDIADAALAAGFDETARYYVGTPRTR